MSLSKSYSISHLDLDSLDSIKSISDDKIGVIALHLGSFDVEPNALVELVFSVKQNAKIFILSDMPSYQEAISLLAKGIRGYANSRMLAQNLGHAVDAVEFGDIWLPPELITELIKTVKPNGASSATKQKLSKKEYEVAKLVSQGHSNIEIADALNIAERTVKSHLTTIYDKLHIKDRLALALLVKNL
jgi:DNA-binding NarL/FixJ family response regulator